MNFWEYINEDVSIYVVMITFAGGSNQEKVRRNCTQKATPHIQGKCSGVCNGYHLCCSCISHMNSYSILGQLTFREILMQDHERAYFDSADWALGKVFWSALICIVITSLRLDTTFFSDWIWFYNYSREDMLTSPKVPLRHSVQSCRYPSMLQSIYHAMIQFTVLSAVICSSKSNPISATYF